MSLALSTSSFLMLIFAILKVVFRNLMIHLPKKKKLFNNQLCGIVSNPQRDDS